MFSLRRRSLDFIYFSGYINISRSPPELINIAHRSSPKMYPWLKIKNKTITMFAGYFLVWMHLKQKIGCPKWKEIFNHIDRPKRRNKIPKKKLCRRTFLSTKYPHISSWKNSKYYRDVYTKKRKADCNGIFKTAYHWTKQKKEFSELEKES